MSEDSPDSPARRIPQVDVLLQSEPFAALIARSSRHRVAAETRSVLDEVRTRALAEELRQDELSAGALAERVAARLEEQGRSYYRPVINATGVVLHTGLGRSSLAPEAAQAVAELAARPQRLEIDLETGERGGRDGGCSLLLTRILGCEDATVVNNNAAATLVAIAALAAGRKVVLSRGEMVEIGGSYRVPEIIAQSGAVLHEVGTTNRTHLKDYRSAVDDGTGALLKVHTSNYQVLGFTSAVPIDQLVELGRERGVPVIHDLGSGCVVELERFDLPPDQLAQRCLAAGADLVCFSGDKLLGGPQCGILAGTKAAVERCREHPLFRAMRPGRLIYAALEATLRIYLDGPEEAARRVPTLACLTLGVDELESRARRLLADLEPAAGVEITMVACASQAGSGSLPLAEIPSRGLRVTVDGVAASELARRLRLGEPAVLGLVRDDALLLDLRAVARSELGPLAARLRELADG